MSSNLIEIENQLPGVASWGIGNGLEGNKFLQATIYPNCINPNQTINIYCASKNKNDLLKIEIFRLGWYSSSGSRPILTLNDVEANNQISWYKTNIFSRFMDKQTDEYLTVVHETWEKSTEILIDKSWTPGIYHARISNNQGSRYIHPFWIFDPKSESRGVMIFPNIGNQKLNKYGNYPTRKKLDFSLTRPYSDSRYGKFFNWCQPLIYQIEKLGLDFIQITDQQLDATPNLISEKDIIICCGDSRYWTRRMLKAVTEFISVGGKLISMQGNVGKQLIDLRSNGIAHLPSINHKSFELEYTKANIESIGKIIGTNSFKSKHIREDAIKHIVKLNWNVDKFGVTPLQKPDTNSKLFKIVILTCVWKRPELTKFVLDYYRGLKNKLSNILHIDLLAVGSEGQKSKKICEESGFDYVEQANLPLSDKWETGINECEKYNSDAVVIVGSDDLLSEKTLFFLCNKIMEGRLIVGLKDMYLYDSPKKKLYHWQGYETDSKQSKHRGLESIGLGRCLSKKLLEKLDYSIWKDFKINKGLDGAMNRKISQIGVLPVNYGEEVWTLMDDGERYAFGHVAFKMEETGGIAVDIKTSENVTAIGKYNKIEVDSKLLSNHFSEEVINIF